MISRILRPSPFTKRIVLYTGLALLVAHIFEVLLHERRLRPSRPLSTLDAPFFSTGCQDPLDNAAQPRENGVLVMLARNSEISGAQHTVLQVERQFNRWFEYPYLFLNDEPWDDAFVEVLNKTVGGRATFEVVPKETWTFPEWTDIEAARKDIKAQGERGIHYGGVEGYHHMCRFYSGKFYTLEALKQYKWYWRLEPDVDYTCTITYDPFVEMARNNKTYGWAISPVEEYNTCPSLFRDMLDWKEAKRVPTTDLWKNGISASWLPQPLRPFLRKWPHRDDNGDSWDRCHYWSNFEIADLDFFRSETYQDLFSYLDHKGGFYHERWGDAPVHSLAVNMLLQPHQIHHFADFGYTHDTYAQCPTNALGGQRLNSETLGPGKHAPEGDGGSGCRCTCDGSRERNYPGTCVQKWRTLIQPEVKQWWQLWSI